MTTRYNSVIYIYLHTGNVSSPPLVSWFGSLRCWTTLKLLTLFCPHTQLVWTTGTLSLYSQLFRLFSTGSLFRFKAQPSTLYEPEEGNKLSTMATERVKIPGSTRCALVGTDAAFKCR